MICGAWRGRRRRLHGHAGRCGAERDREVVSELGRKRRVATRRAAGVGLLGDADRHDPVHVVIQVAIGADRLAPPVAGRPGAIQAAGDLGLPEIAAEAEALRGLAPGEGGADDHVARNRVVDAGGDGCRHAGIVREAGRARIDRQRSGGAGDPDVEGIRLALALRDRDLIEDEIDDGGAGLDRCFREKGNLHRRDQQAVFVVGENLLARGAQMLVVCEQVGLVGIGTDKM